MKKLLLLLVIILGLTVNSNSQTSQTVAQDFTVFDIDGNSYHLFDILSQGKYVYLEFSFIGCPYCVAQIPDMNLIYSDHGCNNKDVVFLSFFSPSDDSTAMVQYRIDHAPLDYPLIYGSQNGVDNGGSVYDYYGFPGNPAGCLIAPNHDVVEQDLYPNGGVHGVFTTYGIGQYPCGIIADFVGTPASIPYGASVNFTDLSSVYPAITWDWTFDNAQTTSSNIQNPAGISYTTIGTHDVTLTVFDGTTISTEVKTNYIEVLAPTSLVAEFTANTTTIVEGQTVDFTDLSLGAIGSPAPNSWNWNFAGAVTTTSTTQNPSSIQYNTPGLYQVSLGVSNGVENNTKTKIDYIEVLDSVYLPAADFTANFTTILAGNSIDFMDLSSNNPSSWNWTFTGSSTTSSTIQNPSGITYPTMGFFPVTLTVTNTVGGGTLTKTGYIKVIDASYIDTVETEFRATTSRLISIDNNVSFEDLSVGYPISWEWEFEGGIPSTSTIQHPSNIFYDVPGKYKVTLVASNGAFVDTAKKVEYIVVTDYPWPDPNGFCDTISNIGDFETEVPPLNIINQWGYIPGHNGYDLNYYADRFTNYTFSQIDEMEVNTASSFKGSTTAKVKFIVWDVDSMGLPGNELAFEFVSIDNITPFNNNTIVFDPPAQVNGEFFAGFKLYYENPGDTFAIYSAGNRGVYGNNSLLVKNGNGWATPTQILGQPYNTSLGIKLFACLVNVDEVELDKNLLIYPNPSSDIVNISLGEMFVNDIEVRVYDLMGREIITELINDGSNNYSLDFSQSTTGIYFVKIRVNSAITTKKVSIIK